MRRKLVAAVLLANLVAGSFAVACSCIQPPPPKAALEEASVVFTGKVMKIEDAGEFQIRVTFAVATSYKGAEKKEIVLFTAKDSAACGYGFKKGESYLVYAHEEKEEDKKQLSTNICTRTTTLEAGKEDLKELGKGTKVK